VKAIAFSIVTSTCLVMACIAPSKPDQFVMIAVGAFCFGALLSAKDAP